MMQDRERALNAKNRCFTAPAFFSFCSLLFTIDVVMHYIKSVLDEFCTRHSALF